MDGVKICDVGRRMQDAHAIGQRSSPLFLWRYDRYTGYGSARLLRAYDGPARRIKLTADRPFSDPEKGARKLLEIANATEAVQDGRIHIEKINCQFLFKESGTPREYSAGLACAVANGWLWKHESGTYVKFTPAGAELFA